MDKYYLDRERALILLVDIQERLLPAMNKQQQLLDKVEVLLKGSQLLGLPIIATEQYPKGLGKTVDAIGGYPTHIYEKIQFSAYTPEVKSAIQETGCTQIIVIGIEAHVCVFQTIRDLLKEGYLVQIPEDGVSSRTSKNKKNALKLIQEMGGVVTNVETILFDLLKEAGSTEFKEISKLIK